MADKVMKFHTYIHTYLDVKHSGTHSEVSVLLTLLILKLEIDFL